MADSKTPDKTGSRKTVSDTWKFTGAYSANYTTPDRVSRWLRPGDEIEWPGGPPDSNWALVEKPAPAESPAPAATNASGE